MLASIADGCRQHRGSVIRATAVSLEQGQHDTLYRRAIRGPLAAVCCGREDTVDQASRELAGQRYVYLLRAMQDTAHDRRPGMIAGARRETAARAR